VRAIIVVIPVLVLVVGCGKKGGGVPGVDEDNTVAPTAKHDNPAASGGCSSDDECVISCDTKDDCCSDPACTKATTAAASQEVLTYRESHCTTELREKCPDKAQPRFTVRAACKEGKCVAIKHSSSQEPVIDVSDYDHACTTASDCILVETSPCKECSCSKAGISAHEKNRYQAARDALECKAANQMDCADCPEKVPACADGVCGVKSK